MKKLLLSTILATALFSAPAMAKVEPDIIRTPYGDFDASGQLLASNVSALKAMNFKAVEKKAKQGDDTAQFYLAKMYDVGIHTPKDDKKALEWYKKSAENGNADAMNNYASILMENAVEKHKKSAENGNTDTTNNTNHFIVNEVVSWYQKASDLNHPNAKMNLAMHYIASKTDIQKGVDLLLELGKNGFAPAYLMLSQVATELPYDIHQNVFKDNDEPMQYAIKSAEMGYGLAQVYLAQFSSMLFFFGADIDENGKKANDDNDRILKTSQNIINAYQWGKRACNNGYQEGCDIIIFYDEFKNLDIDEFKKECESETDPELKQRRCQLYKFHQVLNDEFERIDKRYQ